LVLSYRVEGGKARVALDRPAVHNALSTELRRHLADAFVAADRDDDVLVVILSGEGGRAFSAGGDVKELAQLAADPSRELRVRAHPRVAKPGALSGYDEVYACSKPVIAAIDGYCIGGGLELALGCDVRLATRASTFALPEPRRGMLGAYAMIHLSRAIPLGEALLLHLGAQPMTAERAYQVGLVQGVYEDRPALHGAVDALADAIVANAPLAMQFLKRVVRDGRDMTPEQQWRFSEMYSYEMHASADPNRARSG
jgi:enoyl-CoA hydratase/carnithine racemase